MTAAVVLPAIAALIGSWLGAGLALERFKKERAYELRARWYAEMVDSIQKLHWELNKALRHEENEDISRAQATFEAARPLVDQFTYTMSAGDLYGRPASRAALRKAQDSTNQLGAFRQQLEGMGVPNARPAILRAMLHELDETRVVLVGECRDELFPDENRPLWRRLLKG